MDKIFVSPQFTIYYRHTRRLVWVNEARADYSILVLRDGVLTYSASDLSGEIRGTGALLLGPTQSAQANGTMIECLLLTLAPSYLLDLAARMQMISADASIAFRTPVVETDERFARLATDVAGEMSEELAGRDLVLDSLVAQLTVHVLRRYANARRAGTLELSRAGVVDRRVRRAIELMHANIDRELPLEEIAAAAHLSPFHFARLFKKLMGAAPHAYLASMRGERAQKLLAETDLSVTEVSARVGYSSPSHFSKAFRQTTGLTPREFRQALIARESSTARTGPPSFTSAPVRK